MVAFSIGEFTRMGATARPATLAFISGGEERHLAQRFQSERDGADLHLGGAALIALENVGFERIVPRIGEQLRLPRAAADLAQDAGLEGHQAVS